MTTYLLQHYQLTPGAGGETFYIMDYNKGGGGGGVMINGQGPEAEKYYGQGYGGGGYFGAYGLDGVIIVEISPIGIPPKIL